jgi:ribosomal protein L22
MHTLRAARGARSGAAAPGGRARARGRVGGIQKKLSNLRLVVREREEKK